MWYYYTILCYTILYYTILYYTILLNVCPHIRAPAAFCRSAGTDPLVLRVATYLRYY